MTSEEWRRTALRSDIWVSSQGRVLKRKAGVKDVLIDLRVDWGNYRFFGLRVDGKNRNRYVHILVAQAFMGDRLPGQVIRHIDGNAQNNDISNLTYGTRSENAFDSVEHGTHLHAKKTHCPQGHEYSPINTYHSSSGRHCRTCNRAAAARYKARKTARLEAVLKANEGSRS